MNREAEEAEDRSYRPGWLVFAPFLGRPPPLTRRQWKILGLIALVTLFEHYDLAIFSMALKQIQAELAVPEASLARLGALVHFGAIPAFFFGPIADRLGRRRVLMGTIVAYTLLTGATAFAPDSTSFVVLQFLARMFAVAEVMLAYVVITEELDPESRGWGIGALAALGACGHGLAYGLLPFIHYLPTGWRVPYLSGLGALLAIAWMRRNLPETARFEAHAARRVPTGTLRAVVEPLIGLARMYPGRLAAIGSVIFLLAFAERAASFFGPKYLQEVHGWLPGQISAMGIALGIIGITAGAWAGRASDRYGRRVVAAAFLVAHPIAVLIYYNLGGFVLPPAWILMVFTGMAGGVVLAATANELFPTSYRSTASGARTIIATLGGVLGLSAESALYAITGSHWTAISMLVAVGLAAPVIFWLTIPETAGQNLENVSPER
ncbi:MAG: MFS transporter [bacterium]|nr:MFS transporter [bacterium]